MHESGPVEASCHCGAVRLRLDQAPAEVTDCNCSICRRYGVLWAYYPRRDVQLTSAGTDIYMWDDRAIEFHRCRTCGCVAYWLPADPQGERMGVNARLLPPEMLNRARTRHLDGAVTEQYVNE